MNDVSQTPDSDQASEDRYPPTPEPPAASVQPCATRQKERPVGVFCANGHRVQPDNRYCPECAAPLGPKTSISPRPSSPDLPNAHSAGSARSTSAPQRRIVLVATSVVVAILAAFVVTIGLTRTSTKLVTLQVVYYGGHCQYLRENGSLAEGTVVTVTGDKSSHIAAGALGKGSDGVATLQDGSSSPDCAFTAKFVVPDNQRIYTFTPRGSPGGVSFTNQELTSHKWVVGMSYGCPTNLRGGC
jgi:hypothetical protein